MKTRIFFLILLFFCMKNYSQAQMPYIALSVHVLNKIEEQKQIDTFYQVNYNKATVTIFKDGAATLIPGAASGEGLLFNDLKVMQRMIDEKIFPVKGDGSFWEREKERIMRINENIPYYCSKASDFLGFHVELSNEKGYLKKLTKAINRKFYNQEVSADEYFYIAICIGELIRIQNKGRWVLFPRYSLNIYYIPEIVAERNSFGPIWFVVNHLNEAFDIPIDVEEIIDRVDFSPYGKRSYIEIKRK